MNPRESCDLIWGVLRRACWHINSSVPPVAQSLLLLSARRRRPRQAARRADPAAWRWCPRCVHHARRSRRPTTATRPGRWVPPHRHGARLPQEHPAPLASRFADLRDSPYRLERQLAHRHGHQGQGKERPAHGVDVRDGIGRGDAAKIERIVHDRHEEVGRRDDGLFLADLVHGGVVAGLDADQQISGISRDTPACAMISAMTAGASSQRNHRRVRAGHSHGSAFAGNLGH